MKLIPKYCENVIVGVLYDRKFNWYVTPKDLWRLDYNKEYEGWVKFYEEMGRTQKRFIHEVGSFEEFCKRRWGMAVIDRINAGEFLEKIKKYSVTVNELKDAYDNMDKSDLNPAFFVNFDKFAFYSNFPEPENFESYVPDGWQGNYENFDKRIPKKYVYWEK